MMLQAMIDESQDAKTGIYVLAGYIASSQNWSKLTKEWEELLPLTYKGKSGKYRFKMAEMAQNKERMCHVPAFYWVIEKYVQASISVKININDLALVQKRILVPSMDIDWDKYASPYIVAFRCLMDIFHTARNDMIEFFPKNQKIDFFFDDNSEKEVIIEMWDNYIKNRSEKVREFYGSLPHFKNDEEFLPLQTADFWAWWVRKWYKENTPEKVQKWGFEDFKPNKKRKYLRIEIVINQDDLMENMIKLIRSFIGPEKPIIDLRGLDSLS